MRKAFEDIKSTLKDILLSWDSPEDYADEVAHIMTANSLDGVYTHGINRFSRLVNNIRDGLTLPGEVAEKVSGLGGYEIWDGKLGFGIVNARICTQRAIELSRTQGIGCVSLRNTNHWLRGGTYGIMAAEAGVIGIMATNAKLNMCAWGTMQHSTGNNPLVIAVPRGNGEHVITDTSFSEYSYGKMQVARLEGKMMPSPGGYDENGELSCDPTVIMKSQKILPMGKWKGSALGMMMDLITSVSSFGYCGAMINRMPGDEHAFSQTFIAINHRALGSQEEADAIVDDAVNAVLNATPLPGQSVRYPGQNMLRIREENTQKGIPVNQQVWDEILQLYKK